LNRLSERLGCVVKKMAKVFK